MFVRKGALAAVMIFCLIVSLDAAWGQTGPVVPFPKKSSLWFNSPPLSMSMLRGKGIVLYFFEEGG